MSEALPAHLRKYVVAQDYEKYTSMDQAVWRFILRQLRAFLKIHAHESYLDGKKRASKSSAFLASAISQRKSQSSDGERCPSADLYHPPPSWSFKP
jgi:hypothetical protein